MMEDELLETTQPEGEVSEVGGEGQQAEGELEAGVAQSAEGEGVEPRISADEIARNAELKILRQLFNQGGVPQAPVVKQAPVDPIADLLKGRTDDDLLTVSDVKRLLGATRDSSEQAIRTQMRDMSERVARIRYSDYDDVLDNYTAKMIAKNPDLLDAINRSSDPAEAAYLLGRSHPDFVQSQIKASTAKVADKIQKNATKPKTLSARATGTPRVSSDDRYASMTDADFEKEIQKALNG